MASIFELFAKLEGRITALEKILGTDIAAIEKAVSKPSLVKKPSKKQIHKRHRSPAEGNLLRDEVVKFLQSRKTPVSNLKIKEHVRCTAQQLSFYLQTMSKAGTITSPERGFWILAPKKPVVQLVKGKAG